MRSARVSLPGTVDKIVQPFTPEIPEKAEIGIDGADELYREIRIENELQTSNGETVGLKQGAQVQVTIEAESDATVPKSKLP
jgi:hypothetical protein